jgi:hypothetical protein
MMRRAILSVLLLSLGALPLSAQLTPAQRQERIERDLSLNYNRYLARHLEERALAGDASAYAGPAAYGDRPYWNSQGRWNYLYSRMRAPATGPIHWAAFSQAPEHANALKPLTTARLRAQAGRSAMLTLASPIGGPERTLMIRTAVVGADGAESWTRMGELTADAEGRFLIPIPSLATGSYSLEVQVYDPDRPDAPYSTSRNSLLIE